MAAKFRYTSTAATAKLSLEKFADSTWLDHADGLYKSSGWTTRKGPMVAGSGDTLGLFTLDFASTPANVWTDGEYGVYLHDPADSDRIVRAGSLVMKDGDAAVYFPPTAAAVAGALLDLPNAIETGNTLRQLMRMLRAALVGGLARAAVGPDVQETFKRPDGSTSFTVTHDADGARTGSTIGTN